MGLRSVSTKVPYRGLDMVPFRGCHLGKRTLIYGRNGSGKTTLSELLRSPHENGVTFEVRRDGENQNASVAALSVRVYNRFYVAESLSQFVDGAGDAAPIGVRLGSPNVLIEKEASSREDHHEVLLGRRTAVDSCLRTIKNDIEQEERRVQDRIIAELKAGDPGKYTTHGFTVRPVRKLLSSGEAEPLSAEELESQIATANAPPAQQLTWNPPPAGMRVERPAELNATLLSVEIDTVPIAELAASPALGKWVEGGLELHEAGDVCKFCTNGVVFNDVLERYRQHFSEALERLRIELRSVIDECSQFGDSDERWLQDLPKASSLLPELRDRYQDALSRALERAALRKAAIKQIVERVDQRLADPFTPISPEHLLPPTLPTVDASGVIDLLDQQNQLAQSQSDTQEAARRAVEAHFASVAAPRYTRLQARLKLADNAGGALDRAIETQSSRARQLRESMLDTGHMAAQLDVDLKAHFGLTHVGVTTSSDGKGYVVVRNGEPATWLSEGERNAITFAYFLRTLEAHGVNPSETMVIIDDPATSLDKEALFAVFALAHRRTRDFGQVVFLTHDYEYFRLLLNAHRGPRDRSRKKIKDGDTEEEAFPRVQVLEMLAEVDANNRRSSRLREFPDRLVRSKSEYHYLFEKVAQATLDPDSAELPLLGNAARRLVEGFISFRGPDGDDFQAKVDAVVTDCELDVTTGERIVKFLHGHSHRDDARPNAGLDFPAIADELRLVMRFLHQADQRHFERMCAGVGLSAPGLISAM